jgi:hypothetical protein
VIPPLSDDARTALATAIDGRDHRESAFAALVDAVAAWPAAALDGGGPPIGQPGWDALVAAGDEARGTPVSIEGRLVQQGMLPPPWEHVAEWFVREPDGRPVCVFVVDPPQIRDGTGVRLVGHYYKRIDAEARDGTVHAYPAAVGRILTVRDSNAPAGILFGLLTIGVFLFVLLRRRIRRLRAREAVRRSAPEASAPAAGPLDGPADLPDDPAAALAELRRRSSPVT